MNYSFRAMNSMSPANLQSALKADDLPLLTLVGSQDEAFIANAFPGVMENHRNARVFIVDGETHDGILANSKALDEVGRWHRER